MAQEFFISYSHIDRVWAEKLAVDLTGLDHGNAQQTQRPYPSSRNSDSRSRTVCYCVRRDALVHVARGRSSALINVFHSAAENDRVMRRHASSTSSLGP